MIYPVLTIPNGFLLGVFESLEQIDKVLEDTALYGRGLHRECFGIYREQGAYKTLVAKISVRSLNTFFEVTLL
jgi:hypothetical protein